jgi:hypothetical protein
MIAGQIPVEELISRLKTVYVFIPKSSTTARQKVAELIIQFGGSVP